MRRFIITAIAFAAVLAFGSAAFAVLDIQGAGPITVKLTIQPYTQVWFQDDNWQTPPGPGEPDIVFSPTAGVDPSRKLPLGLIGQYLYTASMGSAEDGWATGYFESTDGATIFMQSNTDFSGSLAITGDLSDGLGHTIPSWFTIAVNGWDPILGVPDPNGFRLKNSVTPGGWVNDGTIPGNGKGGYAGNGNLTGEDVAGPVIPFAFGSQAFWPNQDAFRMATMNGSTFDLDAPVGPGTMKFLARCKRMGVIDVAGNYTATITPTFTAP
jgi:hypothetical protein